MKRIFVALVFTGLVACDVAGPTSTGLMLAEKSDGPTVVWDIEAKPLPEIPLPNNSATRVDPSSLTGRRLNISEEASTEMERRARRAFNQMDGFGVFAPIWVSFDAPIDLEDYLSRHQSPDFRDDPVYLLNVDPECDRFGEEVALDIGGGRYPVTHMRRASHSVDSEAPQGYLLGSRGVTYAYDNLGDSNNLLFSDRFEDLNQNGEIDPGEDLDDDGVLDVPNFIDPSACELFEYGTVEHDRCVADNLLTWYERESNTLILRPLWPLESGCTYGVAITDRVLGEDGETINSPFQAINPRDHTQDLQHLSALLGRYGLGLDNVRFTWSFTTSSTTADMEAIRAGLYGHGPFAELNSAFPLSGFSPWTRGELREVGGIEADPEVTDDVLLPGACSGNGFTWLWGQALKEWPANMCSIEADLSSMDSIFGGSFSAPDLLADKDGQATEAYPATNDEIWKVDVGRGEIEYGSTDVTFWCALPQELETTCSEGNPEGLPFCKPYPVIMYGHGYGGSRAEMSLHMGRHTAMGYAICGLDAYGHGLNVWREDPAASTSIALASVKFRDLEVPEIAPMMTMGRDRDMDNDGVSDPGADMWTSDVIHTRDMVRQTALEHMQFVRILRGMDGVTLGEDGGLLGDLDGDGQVDIGGPQNTIGSWGVSLGGIISGVLAGSEPGLDAASPNAGGAGLGDIGSRSAQAGVPQAVIMPVLGPFIAGCLPTDEHQRALEVGVSSEHDCHEGRGSVDGPFEGGQLRLLKMLNDRASMTYREIGEIRGVQPGDRVVLENLSNGEIAVGRVNERGWFRLAVPSDALDSVERRAKIGLKGNSFGTGTPDANTLLGDALALRVYVGETDEERGALDIFQLEVIFQGTRYIAGSPLVALQEGLGKKRNNPDMRRFMSISQHALSSADPGAWAAHIFLEPLDVSYDPNVSGGNTHVLMMPTVGDSQVPTNTGIAMARASGVLGSWLRDESVGPEYGWRAFFVPDERLGKTPDDYLLETYVVEGDPRLERYGDYEKTTPGVLYDIDNVSDSTAQFSCGNSDWSGKNGENGCEDAYRGQEVFFDVPNPEPGEELRWNQERSDGSFDAFRVPLLRPAGQHGIYNSQSFRVFDTDAYMVNFTVRFLGSRGEEVGHESGCDCSASELPNFLVNGEASTPGLLRSCTEDDVKVCDSVCADGWGLLTPQTASCETGGE